MEKIRSREEVVSQLKEKEKEINRHIEALQKEVLDTGSDIKDYVKKNAWVGIAGSVAAGVLVGLVLGKKSKKTQHKELVEDYLDRLADVARRSGADDREVGALLRDALRETMPSVVYTSPQKRSGVGGMLLGLGTDMLLGFAQKSVMNFLDAKVKPGEALESREDADND